MERWLWHLTAVYNWTVRKIEQDARDGVFYSRYQFKALLNGHSKRIGIPAEVLCGVAVQAHDAWKRCRSGQNRRPRLKGRRNRLSSIPSTHGFPVLPGNKVNFPGFPRLRFHEQVIPAGRIGMGRIIRRASGWYLCLFIQADPRPIKAVAYGVVGIDSGFSQLLTISTGEIVEHPRELEAGADRLAQAQRGNRSRLAARLQERQANRRKDRNHKLSRRLVAENAVIAWSKDSTRGIARKFGKSVSSSAHSQLRQQLAYKSRSGCRRFVEVASRNSTRTCSVCGALSGPSGWQQLKVRQWRCTCGVLHDRDVNAAMNALTAALGSSVDGGREAASGIVISSNTTKTIWAGRLASPSPRSGTTRGKD